MRRWRTLIEESDTQTSARAYGAATAWAVRQGLRNGSPYSKYGFDYAPGLQHTAVVSDRHNMLVALVRNPAENLRQLLDRLEAALGPAIDDQVFIDEINGPRAPPPKLKRR